MNQVYVRCSQISPVINEIEHNRRLIAEEIRRAVMDRVDLLVLPELATSGYDMTPTEVVTAALTREDPFFAELSELISTDLHVVFGFPEQEGDIIYNSAVVLNQDGVCTFYRKTHLWNTEKELFTPGSSLPDVIHTPFGRLSVIICYDLEIPELPRSVAQQGVDLLAVPVNWPLLDRPESEHAPEVLHAMVAARSSGIAIACCDRSGEERGTAWTQGSCIVGTDGWIMQRYEDEVRVDATLTIDPDRYQISERNNIAGDRRPELYGSLTTKEFGADPATLLAKVKREQ